MEFKIEKSIRPPRREKSKWPFGEMEINDSFLIGNDRVEIDRCRAAASYWGKKHGGENFSIQKTDEGHRCWRIK